MNGHKYKTFRPPARVWIDEDSEWWPTQSRSDTEEYIRADLVDDLVEALEEIIDRWDSPLWKDLPHTKTYIAKGRTALAKIKEGE